MRTNTSSRLTQSFLGLNDKEFRTVPGLEKALIDTINQYIDAHQVSGGAIGTALACVIGEMIMMASDTEHAKEWFLRILDAYISTGSWREGWS